jgi:hypothetical protein
MKIIALLVVILTAPVFGVPCGPDGDSTNPRIIALDRLKNREVAPASFESVDWIALTASGDDIGRFDSTKGGTLTGYVVLVKDGGAETCHCGSTTEMDTHIEVVSDRQYATPKMVKIVTIITSGKNKGKKRIIEHDLNQKYHVIVEVTPQFRAVHPEWTTRLLKQSIEGHTVTFSGYLFYDEEHKQNAFNTAPGNQLDWRATCWELHPVTGITIIR